MSQVFTQSQRLTEALLMNEKAIGIYKTLNGADIEDQTLSSYLI